MLSVLRNPKLFCNSSQRMTQLMVKDMNRTNQSINQFFRLIGDSRQRVNSQAFRRIEVKKQTLKERLMSPTTGLPFDIGKGVMAGSALFGVAALCYYGLGLSSEPGIYDKSMFVCFNQCLFVLYFE